MVNKLNEYFSDLWEYKEIRDREIEEGDERRVPLTMFPPIELEEVVRKRNKMNPKGAPGPDGVRREHLYRLGVMKMVVLVFNILLRKGVYPSI